MIHYSIESEPKKLDALIVPVFEDKPFEPAIATLDKQFNNALSNVKTSKDFEGKKLQTAVLYTHDKNVQRILLIGMGKQKEMTARRWKQAIGSAVIAVEGKKWTAVGFHVPTLALKKLGAKRAGLETAIAIETADYAYDDYKDKDAKVTHLKQCAFAGILGNMKRQFEQGLAEGESIASGVNWTRHLGNTPPTVMTPTYLATQAELLAREFTKLSVKVLSRPEMKKLGMGCLLGVSRGSREEPKFIVLEYHGGKKSERPTILVGKGITFDSGGLSLKPSASMADMKFDMLGAATVLGTFKAAVSLGLKKNLVGLIPSCENMPGGEAYRPDDILVAMNGKSVEVANTDAEGRLILADALSYAAKKYQAKEVIDFATLTGACLVAIGVERSGLFSPVDSVAKKLLASSEQAGEQLWRLPLGEEYSEAMKSEVADIRNIDDSRNAGASTAAAFLQFFTRDDSGEPAYPWAHIDLSSAYASKKGKPWIRVGANGFGVQTMVEYLR